MKKTILILGLMLCGILNLFAETTLTDVCNGLSKHPNMTGDFTQIKGLKQVNRNLKSNGIFVFSLDGIMWKTLKPFPSTLAVGKTSVIQTKADGKQTVIDASTNQIFTSISSTLVSFFSGDEEGLTKNFTSEFSSTGDKWSCVLTPKDKSVQTVLKSLSFSGTKNSENTELDTILLTESNEDTISYLFTNQKYPKELTDAEKAYFIAK